MTLHDPVTGVSLEVPGGAWGADTARMSSRTGAWRNTQRYEGVVVRLVDRFPGRPRIEYQMHGMAELERCREPWGRDSAWVATGFAPNNPDYRGAFAILPQPDGRWLLVSGYSEDDWVRQLEWLAAVRTARVE